MSATPTTLPGKMIDVLFMFGLIGGVGTSIGLGTPMLSAGISELFGVDRSFMLGRHGDRDLGSDLCLQCLFGA